MKYFIDTEFLEGAQDKRFLGFKYRVTKPTIDLISIGMVSEDGREYYAISKDFNLKEAWNRYDVKVEQMSGDARNLFPEGKKSKVYWIRENVLYQVWLDLEFIEHDTPFAFFTYSRMKYLLAKHGKTNEQIAEEINDFCFCDKERYNQYGMYKLSKPEFYGYYSDYDWVVFCWLFGKMIDLPKGFPMFCIDLKQEYDRLNEIHQGSASEAKYQGEGNYGDLMSLKYHINYPKQTDEHNALSDAKWNKELYNFLQQL